MTLLDSAVLIHTRVFLQLIDISFYYLPTFSTCFLFPSSYLLFRLGMLALSSAVHVYYFIGNFLLFVLFL